MHGVDVRSAAVTAYAFMRSLRIHIGLDGVASSTLATGMLSASEIKMIGDNLKRGFVKYPMS
jgi:hypothetical protein